MTKEQETFLKICCILKRKNYFTLRFFEDEFDFKNRLAAKLGYTLLRVWEDDIKNVPKYIL